MVLVLFAVVSLVGWNDESQPDAAEVQPSASNCGLGGPAALKAVRVPPGTGVKLESPVLVLGCKKATWHGLLQVVGFRTSQAVCAAADSPREGDTAGILCVPPGSPSRPFCGDKAVCAGPLSWSEGASRNGYSRAVGQVSPQVDDVEVSFVNASGVKRRVEAVVAQVRGNLLTKLGGETEFGVFAAVLPGCSPASGATVIAKDGAGETIGTSHARNPAPGFCEQT